MGLSVSGHQRQGLAARFGHDGGTQATDVGALRFQVVQILIRRFDLCLCPTPTVAAIVFQKPRHHGFLSGGLLLRVDRNKDVKALGVDGLAKALL